MGPGSALPGWAHDPTRKYSVPRRLRTTEVGPPAQKLGSCNASHAIRTAISYLHPLGMVFRSSLDLRWQPVQKTSMAVPHGSSLKASLVFCSSLGTLSRYSRVKRAITSSTRTSSGRNSGQNFWHYLGTGVTEGRSSDVASPTRRRVLVCFVFLLAVVDFRRNGMSTGTAQLS